MRAMKSHAVIVSSLLLLPFYAACQGPPGPPGPQGPQGLQGQQGLAGVSGYEIVVASGWFTLEPGKRRTVTATCPSGKKVLGGGFDTTDVDFMRSAPVDDQTWQVRVENRRDVTIGIPITVRAICAIVEE